MIEVATHETSQATEWNTYVCNSRDASSYHLWQWRALLGASLGHRPHYLSARREGRLCGILPLICLSRPPLARVLVSLPFVNYGGILADDAEAARALLDAGVELAGRLGARSLELRHRQEELAALPARTHRVTMVLELPDSVDDLWRSLLSKVRSHVRKAEKLGLRVYRGGLPELPAFYEVFAQNMRDLGSPVWPRSFFQRILETFPERTRIYRVDLGSRPIAAGLILRFQQTVEIPWASSVREYNHLNANMLLYWQMLADATLEGYSRFDFGRSAPDSSTYRFKRQWGAQEYPLFWHRWPDAPSAGGALEARRNVLEEAWRRLPLWSTRVLGPPIRRCLPQ